MNDSDTPFPVSDRSLDSERTMRGDAPASGRRLRSGDVLLDRYTVLSELGEGGMGVVCKCLDKVGGIEVAVKCLPPELSRNAGEMEGIRENYAIVAKLHHSAISGLRQLERDPATGEYYLVMDLAEGEDLSAILRRRRGAPMPLAEALEILRPLAAALDYAHGEKVLHRDVKPANVKVRPAAEPGEAPRVQLLDFGLAAEIRSSMSRVSVRGHAGTSGTPSYMAPEQWEARRPDFRTDQYALAVVAYQMLAGFLPFDSEDTDLLRRAVLSRAPDPVEGLPPAANAALLRALSKDPKERFPTCAAFVEALSLAAHPPERPAPSGGPLRAERPVFDSCAAIGTTGPARPENAQRKLVPSAQTSDAGRMESAERGRRLVTFPFIFVLLLWIVLAFVVFGRPVWLDHRVRGLLARLDELSPATTAVETDRDRFMVICRNKDRTHSPLEVLREAALALPGDTQLQSFSFDADAGEARLGCAAGDSRSAYEFDAKLKQSKLFARVAIMSGPTVSRNDGRMYFEIVVSLAKNTVTEGGVSL